jgi:hypothetical protein
MSAGTVYKISHRAPNIPEPTDATIWGRIVGRMYTPLSAGETPFTAWK